MKYSSFSANIKKLNVFFKNQVVLTLASAPLVWIGRCRICTKVPNNLLLCTMPHRIETEESIRQSICESSII